jgi:hypothetical protein
MGKKAAVRISRANRDDLDSLPPALPRGVEGCRFGAGLAIGKEKNMATLPSVREGLSRNFQAVVHGRVAAHPHLIDSAVDRGCIAVPGHEEACGIVEVDDSHTIAQKVLVSRKALGSRLHFIEFSIPHAVRGIDCQANLALRGHSRW